MFSTTPTTGTGTAATLTISGAVHLEVMRDVDGPLGMGIGGFQAPNTSIDPRPANSKVTPAPATTGTGAVTPPEKMSWPAFRVLPSTASWLASQATDAAGCPMTA